VTAFSRKWTILVVFRSKTPGPTKPSTAGRPTGPEKCVYCVSLTVQDVVNVKSDIARLPNRCIASIHLRYGNGIGASAISICRGIYGRGAMDVLSILATALLHRRLS
jgi:hypothetical protein